MSINIHQSWEGLQCMMASRIFRPLVYGPIVEIYIIMIIQAPSILHDRRKWATSNQKQMRNVKFWYICSFSTSTWNLFSLLSLSRTLELDNNNCTPSFLRSLCEMGDYCFWTEVFFWESAASKKNYQGPKQSLTNSHNDRKSRWCKVIIVITTVTAF